MKKIETKRAVLRRFRAEDLPRMLELESDPDVMRFTAARVVQTREQSEQRLRSVLEKEAERAPLGVWAAEMKNSGDFIGWFMLLKTELEFPELGFMVVKRHWGKGLTTEIAGALVKHGMEELGEAGVVAVTSPRNAASRRVLEKLGFRPAGHLQVEHKATGEKEQLDRFELRREGGAG